MTSPVLDHSRDPVWLKDTQAPTIHNEAELDHLWQSVPRCCGESVQQNNRIFAKACSKAIDSHPADTELVVKCLWLMSGLPEEPRPQRQYLKEIVMQRYSHHRDSLRRCAHCAPGDTVSRTAQELAWIYASSNRLDDALSLLENIMSLRRSDTSGWVRIESWTEYGQLLLKSKFTVARKQKMDAACDVFKEIKDEETIRRRYTALSKVCQQVRMRTP